jgi:nicotinate-nucleotide adenylyltransferase
VAALLHDVLKETDSGELWKRIKGSAIIDVAGIEHSPATWHAYAGGVYLLDELGLEEDIALAVMYHTAGRAGMSLLEKVVFVADYISPDRDFRGVAEVREAAETSLDEACVLALRNGIAHICRMRKHIDINSVLAFNDLIDNRSGCT